MVIKREIMIIEGGEVVAKQVKQAAKNKILIQYITVIPSKQTKTLTL
jgi:hypothetical protein